MRQGIWSLQNLQTSDLVSTKVQWVWMIYSGLVLYWALSGLHRKSGKRNRTAWAFALLYIGCGLMACAAAAVSEYAEAGFLYLIWVMQGLVCAGMLWGLEDGQTIWNSMLFFLLFSNAGVFVILDATARSSPFWQYLCTIALLSAAGWIGRSLFVWFSPKACLQSLSLFLALLLLFLQKFLFSAAPLSHALPYSYLLLLFLLISFLAAVIVSVAAWIRKKIRQNSQERELTVLLSRQSRQECSAMHKAYNDLMELWKSQNGDAAFSPKQQQLLASAMEQLRQTRFLYTGSAAVDAILDQWHQTCPARPVVLRMKTGFESGREESQTALFLSSALEGVMKESFIKRNLQFLLIRDKKGLMIHCDLEGEAFCGWMEQCGWFLIEDSDLPGSLFLVCAGRSGC